MIRPTSACTTARCSVPRALDSTTAVSSVSLIFLLPSNATRPSTGASDRCTAMRSPARSIVTLSNRPVASSRLEHGIQARGVEPPVGAAWKYERTVSASTRRLPCTSIVLRACASALRTGAGLGCRRRQCKRRKHRDQQCTCRSRSPARRWALPHEVPPVSHLTDAIEVPARGETMSGRKVSCCLSITVRHDFDAAVDRASQNRRIAASNAR